MSRNHSKKRHAISMPGVMLDSIRDNEGSYENDERFTKRAKLQGPSVIHRKENRKRQRMEKKSEKKKLTNELKKQFENNKKNVKSKKPNSNKSNFNNKVESSKKNNDKDLKKNKKRVSFSDHDQIREIPNRETLLNMLDSDINVNHLTNDNDDNDDDTDSDLYSDELNDTDDLSDDELDFQDEKDASELINTLKQLKQVQRDAHGLKNDDDAEELDDEQIEVMNQLAALKGKKSKLSELKIVKEDDLVDDSMSEESESNSGSEELEEEEELDEEQSAVMNQLAALKNKKKNKSTPLKIVKEDDLDDDSMSDFSGSENEEKEELDEEQESIMKQLAALKGNKSLKKSSLKIVKEDEIDDDSLSEDGNEDEEEQDKLTSDLDLELETAELDEERDAIMKQLAALKGKKSKSPLNIKIVKEDELDDDSISEDMESEDDDRKDESEEEYDEPNFVSQDDDDMAYYAKKLGLSSKKGLSRQDDDDMVGGLLEGLDFMDKYNDFASDDESEIRAKKVKIQENTKDKTKEKKSNIKRNLSEKDLELLKQDEEEINYYAKKLGIDPKKGLKKQDDDDIIGDLLDGLDFDISDEHESNDYEAEDESQSEEDDDRKSKDGRSKNGDDEVDSDDFDNDDDLDEDDKALLREMYGLESSDSEDDSEFDSDDNDGPRVKENPYMAPVDPNSVTEDAAPAGSKYIPPALRRKMAMGELNGDSETVQKLVRLIKGPFNKLSEPNMNSVISDLNNIYNDNPRHFVNEAILKVILQSVSISTPMLESFLVLYASAIVALYKLQGVEFGAFMIQKLVEEFEKEIETNSRTKQELLNIAGLLGYLYTLNLVSSTLVYDIIKMKLIKDSNELKTDILLKLIRSCGSKLRSDDSTALNSIIAELTTSVKQNENRGIKTSTRSRFLIDTITDLKNNRLKNLENENTLQMINRIKKQLGSINNGRGLDPIKVNLDDIENIEERGKWWLVGSAWKGLDNKSDNKEMKSLNEQDINDLSNVNEKLINNEDELSGSSEVNWLELAKQCRMNTDIRRAIFISIMSAEDFMDSFAKLEKLNLKKSQKAEIPNILMHCATMEANNNPYYSHLAKKLCDDHAMRRSFQLNLWDFIKELDGDDSGTTTILIDTNDEERLWKILNMGRFFGFLIGEGSLSLNLLRVINFLTASSDVKIFLEIMLITILDTIAKKSQTNNDSVKSSKNIEYTGKVLSDRLAKCEEQPLLLKGLQYFLNDKILKSNLIKGKKQRSRIEWAVDTMTLMIDELSKSQK